jgi:hypothetical protein
MKTLLRIFAASLSLAYFLVSMLPWLSNILELKSVFDSKMPVAHPAAFVSYVATIILVPTALIALISRCIGTRFVWVMFSACLVLSVLIFLSEFCPRSWQSSTFSSATMLKDLAIASASVDRGNTDRMYGWSDEGIVWVRKGLGIGLSRLGWFLAISYPTIAFGFEILARHYDSIDQLCEPTRRLLSQVKVSSKWF